MGISNSIVFLALTASLLLPIPKPATHDKCPPGAREYYSPACADDEHFNGYWWRDESWVPGYVSRDTWFMPAPIWSEGKAVYYAPGVMEATAAYRDLDLTGYMDGVAMASPADIGRDVWLKLPDGEWEGPYLVVDCAKRGDIYPITVGRGEVVEVGFRTAERWGMVNYTGGNSWEVFDHVIEGTQVSFVYPDLLDFPTAPEMVDFPDWWLEKAEFTNRVDNGAVFLPPQQWYIDGQTYDWTTTDYAEMILSRYWDMLYIRYMLDR